MTKKLNVDNLITFILYIVVIFLGGILAGIIDMTIEGLLTSISFLCLLIFIGYLIHKSELGN